MNTMTMNCSPNYGGGEEGPPIDTLTDAIFQAELVKRKIKKSEVQNLRTRILAE